MLDHFLAAMALPDLFALAREAPGVYIAIWLVNLLACQATLLGSRRQQPPQARLLRGVAWLGHLINAGLGVVFLGVRWG